MTSCTSFLHIIINTLHILSFIAIQLVPAYIDYIHSPTLCSLTKIVSTRIATSL